MSASSPVRMRVRAPRWSGDDDILAASHGVGRHPSARAKPSATRVIPALVAMVSGPFARAMLTAFFFFGSLNGFVLLPLYIHQLGGNEAAIGLVQGMYSTAGILCQPLVGAWIDRIGRRFFMVLGVTVLTVSCAAFFVANYLHVVELVPHERRGWALGIYGLSGLVSTSLAPLAGEFLARHFG